MLVAGVREFRDKATEMLRSKEPILVMRRGEVTGFYFPFPSQTLPVELKKELFDRITQEIGRRLREAGVVEGELLIKQESGWKNGIRRM